ncbi:MAG TPA: MFS transporter [Armatimonadota bacterium]|mgnify:CR=1 FL=1|nr:MFS transporter [Armatimonadota bacterium]HOS43424.1 MFS transporter [Armatimonadota bacterium]
MSDTAQTTPTPVPEEERYRVADIRLGLRNILLAAAATSAFTALTTGAVFTSFLTRCLRVDDFWYGIIMAMAPAAVFAQFFGSLAAERSGRIKPKYLTYCLPQRLLWAVIALTLVWILQMPLAARMALLAALFFITAFFQHFGAGGTLAWFSRLVPLSAAGKFFGYRQRSAMIAMLVVATLVSVLLDRFEWQGWLYVIIFLAATAFGLADLLFIRAVPEHPRPVEGAPPTLKDILRAPWQHPAFRWYAPFMFLTGIAVGMMDPFLWRYCYESAANAGLGMSVFLANLFLAVAPTLIMAWMAPHWGQVLDRVGPKSVLVLATVGNLLVSSVWLLMRQELLWLIPVQTLFAGMANSGIAQVEIHMRVRGFSTHRHTTYLASLNVLNGLAGMTGAALGGILASFWKGQLPLIPGLPAWVSHYHPLFLTALLLRVLVFAFLLVRLPLPGDVPGGRVLRELGAAMAESLGRRRRRPAGKSRVAGE